MKILLLVFTLVTFNLTNASAKSGFTIYTSVVGAAYDSKNPSETRSFLGINRSQAYINKNCSPISFSKGMPGVFKRQYSVDDTAAYYSTPGFKVWYGPTKYDTDLTVERWGTLYYVNYSLKSGGKTLSGTEFIDAKDYSGPTVVEGYPFSAELNREEEYDRILLKPVLVMAFCNSKD